MSFLEIYNFLKEHGISKTQMDLIVEVVRRNDDILEMVLKEKDCHWSQLGINSLEGVLKLYNEFKEPDLLIVGYYINEPMGYTSIMSVSDIYEEEPKATYVLATKEEIEKINKNMDFTKEEKEVIVKRKHYTYEELMQ